MELTYNQIIKTLNDFATSHYQINEFGNGDLWEVIQHDQQKDFNYPLLWVQDQPNTTTQGEIEMVFRCFFINLVQKDESNENEVKSDMQQCCLDLLAFWKKQTDYRTVSIDVNTSLTSFTERFNDELTGWWIDIKISQQFNYDKCSIPMDGITPIPTNCSPATITINGQSFTTADSGTLKDIIVKDTDGTSVGSKIGTEWIVPASAVCGDADNQVNGVAKTAIPSGGSKNFAITYANGDPIVVTEVSDSAAAFNGTVPDILVPGRIYIRPKNTNSSAQYFTFDDYWKKTNNADSYVPPSSGTPMLLDPDDPKLLIPDNTFNHKFVITGSSGGYYDHLTSGYKDVSGVATTKALAFPLDYYINHHTGLGGLIVLPLPPAKTISASYVAVDALVSAGFSDYFIPNVNELFAQIHKGDEVGFTTQANYPPFDLLTTDQKFSSTRYYNGTLTMASQGGGTINLSSDTTAQSIVVMRYHFT